VRNSENFVDCVLSFVYTQRVRDTILSFHSRLSRVCMYVQFPARDRMTRSSCGPLSALVLLSLLTAESSTAFASCGDYVHVGSPQAAQPDVSLASGTFERSAFKFSAAPFDPKPSCRGPGCSAHSPAPAAPPRTVQRFDHSACLSAPTRDCGCYKMSMRTEMALFVPEGHPFLHKRPPRTSTKG
jgi:hypothetical protein